jgi:hypothetical protein
MGFHQCKAASGHGCCELEEGHEESHQVTITRVFTWEAVVCTWCGLTEAEHNTSPDACGGFETKEQLLERL